MINKALKTLKDLDFKGLVKFIDQEPEKGVEFDVPELKKRLRQEGIKHIKYGAFRNKCELDKVEKVGAIKWIKYFFNITEEDLK